MYNFLPSFNFFCFGIYSIIISIFNPHQKNRGSVDTKLLDVRVFGEATRKSVYSTQTTIAETKSESNCPHCALGHDANKSKIWKLAEMDADHVAAWSKGDATDSRNCQMLCKTHNRDEF